MLVPVLRWSVLGIGALASGALFIQSLTAHPVKMGRYHWATATSLFAAIAALFLGFRGLELWIAAPLALGLALLGYVWMTRRVLSRKDPRAVPELTRHPNDPGRGHTTVIYLTHGEPETYNPIGWINQFREFDEQNVRFVPFFARPFFIHHLRKIYLVVGRSNHRQMHQQMLRSLERSFRAEGDTTTRFYLCFLDDDPRPDTAVIRALNEGASRILVSEVFLTISNHTAEGNELIEELPLEGYSLPPIRYTGPLWDSEPLQKMFVARANARLDGVDKGQVGVLLVGHGQPTEWDEIWPTETTHEIAFRENVLKRFEQDGYRPENLSMAWMEFRSPKPAQKIEEFVRNGVHKIFYFSAAISADALHSQYDIPHLISQARVPDDVELVNVGAWNIEHLLDNSISSSYNYDNISEIHARRIRREYDKSIYPVL